MNTTGTHSHAGGLNIKLLTPKELAGILRISLTGVYRLVEGRKIRFYRVRGTLRFDARDIESYLQSGCVEPIMKNYEHKTH